MCYLLRFFYQNFSHKILNFTSSVGKIAVFVENIEEIKAYIAEYYADSKAIVLNYKNPLPIVTKNSNATENPHILHWRLLNKVLV